MKVLLHSDKLKTIEKSGVGRAIKHQMKALELNNVEYTFKYENVDNFEYIRAEVENRDIETRGLFKRVHVTNEDGSKSTYYEYVS
jgi:1,2-diacylglycerol-3-alpha-glucose alpha-1,2-glucosyltransferase